MQPAHPTLSAGAEASLRQVFKRFNPFMVTLFRLGLGGWLNSWPEVGGRIMVLAHTGHRTGRRRLTPVNFACVDGELYCAAGFGVVSDWYQNVRANPRVEVWLPEGWRAGEIDEVTDPALRLRAARAVILAAGFAGALAGVDPRAAGDEALARLTANYRVLHITRTAARTGEGGPNDLVWLWPVVTGVLVARLWLARRRR